MFDDDLIPVSVIIVCDRCGRQYMRAVDNDDPCPWCEIDATPA